MERKASCRTVLPEKDLNFVVRTATPESRNKDQLKQLINEDQDFRESLLSNQELFRQITSNYPWSLGISPLLYFEVLLREAIKEMEKATHTVERTISQRIPVFDIDEALELLKEDEVFYYLVHLLTAFVRCDRDTINDFSIDRLVKLGETVRGDHRFFLYRRIADTCLFILGIFPEHLTYDYIYLFSGKKLPISGELKRSMGDYEALGQEFYSLAAELQTAKIRGLREVLRTLSENFYLVKKPLNLLSEHYLAIAPV